MIIKYKLTKILRSIGLLLCLPLTGCLDVAQELWVYEDGRGRIKTEIGLHEQLMLIKGRQSDEQVCDDLFEEKQILEKREGVESVEYKSYKEAGVLFCAADISVSNFILLASLQDESLKEGKLGALKNAFQAEFSIEELDDGNWFFRQHIRNQASAPDKHKLESQAELLTGSIMGRLMTGRYWSMTLHAPTIVETNGELSDKNKTVSWRVPLYDLLIDEHYAFDMQAKFETNVPWYKKFWNWMN